MDYSIGKHLQRTRRYCSYRHSVLTVAKYSSILDFIFRRSSLGNARKVQLSENLLLNQHFSYRKYLKQNYVVRLTNKSKKKKKNSQFVEITFVREMASSCTNLHKKSSSQTMLDQEKPAEATKEVDKVDGAAAETNTDDYNSGTEDWETLYVGPSEKEASAVGEVLHVKQKPDIKEPEKIDGTKLSDEELTAKLGDLTDEVLRFMIDSEDDIDSGFTVVKSKGTKARERRDARLAGAQDADSAATPLPKKKFSVMAEDKFMDKANDLGSSYVNLYLLNKDKCRDAFNSVDKDGNPTNDKSGLTPKLSPIFLRFGYTETQNSLIMDSFEEKLSDDNTVMFTEPPAVQPNRELACVGDPCDGSDSDPGEDDFFGADKPDCRLLVEVSKDRKKRVFKRSSVLPANSLSWAIRLIPYRLLTLDEYYCNGPDNSPPGIQVTNAQRELNMNAANRTESCGNWRPGFNASRREKCPIYSREVDRALCGDTTGHPKRNSESYFKTAENYALYGDYFMDFPPDIKCVLAAEPSVSTDSSSVESGQLSAGHQAVEVDTDSDSTADNLSQSVIVEEPNESESESEEDERPTAPVSNPVVELVSPLDIWQSVMGPLETQSLAVLMGFADGVTSALTGDPLINFTNHLDMPDNFYGSFLSPYYGSAFNGYGYGLLSSYDIPAPPNFGGFFPMSHPFGMLSGSLFQPPPNEANQAAAPPPPLSNAPQQQPSPIPWNAFFGGNPVRPNGIFSSLHGGVVPPGGSAAQPQQSSTPNDRPSSSNNTVMPGGAGAGGGPGSFVTQQMHFNYPHEPPPSFQPFAHGLNPNTDNTQRP